LKGIPSLAAQPKLFLENQLVLIREGVRDIPSMKGMLDGVTDAEVTALAQYYADKPLAAVPTDRDAEVFARGGKLAEALRIAEHWLDATGLPAAPDAGVTGVLDRSGWIDTAIVQLRRIVDPIAQASTEALIGLASQQLGELGTLLDEDPDAMRGALDLDRIGSLRKWSERLGSQLHGGRWIRAELPLGLAE
jgi:hypothetical protein